MSYDVLRSFLRPAGVLFVTMMMLAFAPQPTMAKEINEVFVIGTLYKRHEQVPAFSVEVLKRLIADIKPSVLVLDVTPTELKEKTVFPLLAQQAYIVYAAEPAEPLFSEIVQAVAQAHQQFPKDKPTEAAALKQFEEATYTLLKQHWTSVANVQDEITDAAMRATIELSGAMLGPDVRNNGSRWDRHTADVVLKAVAEHPGKRILVLTGIRNRPHVTENLRAAPAVTLIDMPSWLRQHGYVG